MVRNHRVETLAAATAFKRTITYAPTFWRVLLILGVHSLLSIPLVLPEHVHPPAHFAACVRAVRRPVRSEGRHAAAAIVSSYLAIALDLVDHLLSQPDREALVLRDLDRRPRAGYRWAEIRIVCKRATGTDRRERAARRTDMRE